MFTGHGCSTQPLVWCGKVFPSYSVLVEQHFVVIWNLSYLEHPFKIILWTFWHFGPSLPSALTMLPYFTTPKKKKAEDECTDSEGMFRNSCDHNTTGHFLTQDCTQEMLFHESIHYLYYLSFQSYEGAGANPIWQWVRRRVHHGQVVSHGPTCRQQPNNCRCECNLFIISN